MTVFLEMKLRPLSQRRRLCKKRAQSPDNQARHWGCDGPAWLVGLRKYDGPACRIYARASKNMGASFLKKKQGLRQRSQTYGASKNMGAQIRPMGHPGCDGPAWLAGLPWNFKAGPPNVAGLSSWNLPKFVVQECRGAAAEKAPLALSRSHHQPRSYSHPGTKVLNAPCPLVWKSRNLGQL